MGGERVIRAGANRLLSPTGPMAFVFNVVFYFLRFPPRNRMSSLKTI
jgi:hypothetical protein